MSPHIGECLARKEITLQTNIAVTTVEHERVDERVYNQVVLAFGRPQKVASIIKMNLYTWILVRLIGMILPSEAIDSRVYFDCVNMVSAPLQRTTDIITGTGADDH